MLKRLYKEFLPVFQWSISIGRKFFIVVPKQTYVIVILSLVSKISLILAFLLPLKILLLLGSKTVPHYFPSLFLELERNQLVILLVILTITFYAVHNVSEKLIKVNALQGSNLLLTRSQKITLFENQKQIAEHAYTRYSKTLAALTYAILALFFIGLIYLKFVFIILSFYICLIFTFTFLYEYNTGISKNIDKYFNSISSAISSIGFFFGFIYMVYDFLYGTAPSILIAIITLVLLRQITGQISSLTINTSTLYKQRLQINTLFFHGHILKQKINKSDERFWSLFETGIRDKWISKVLDESLNFNDIRKIDFNWWQTGIRNVIACKVIINRDNQTEPNQYLIKLFNFNKTSLALHEADFFSACSSLDLPTINLIAVTQVEKHHCHIFEFEDTAGITSEVAKEQKLNTMIELMANKPPQILFENYKRSRPFIWQRLNYQMIHRLSNIASSGQKKQLNLFNLHFDYIINTLKSLPLQIVNPDITSNTMVITNQKNINLIHWGRWSIEPIGTRWPIEKKNLKNLDNQIDNLKKKRNDMNNISAQEVKLSALCFMLESNYERQYYNQVFVILNELINYLPITK